jgi:acetolactate decarboxylase
MDQYFRFNFKTMKIFILLVLVVLIPRTQSFSQTSIIGAMKDVMWNGQLAGKINLDTLLLKNSLYGLGPIEGLTGEILIYNGKIYESYVSKSNSLRMDSSWNVKAPFFAYESIDSWTNIEIPKNINNLASLENLLIHLNDSLSSQFQNEPFLFRLEGPILTATIHIVNHPIGEKVTSPKDAHKGQKNMTLQNESVNILGFFSTKHQTIFTHHDTYLHAHLINSSSTRMGHLESLEFDPQDINLMIPTKKIPK